MGTVATAVGCAVGIPIGVGIIIAGAFWYRLQRRFKEELEEDKVLEAEIYDESGYINFNNLQTMKQDINNTNTTDAKISDDFSKSNGSTDNILHKSHRKKSNVYVPAYRRNFTKTINDNTVNNNTQIDTDHDNNNDLNLPKKPLPSLSRDSMNSNSNLNLPKQNSVRQLSVYDQMVPFFDNNNNNMNSSNSNINSPNNNKNNNSNSNTATSNNLTGSNFTSNKTNNNPDSNDQSSTVTNNNNNSINNDALIRNLNQNDLGSYYPGAPTSTLSINNTNKLPTSVPSTTNSLMTTESSINNSPTKLHNSSFNTGHSRSNSQSNNSNNVNIFATPPRSKTNNNKFESENENNLDSEFTDTDDDLDNSHMGNRKNNLQSQNDVIMEEDQYENEFTNYSENKRQFIDSLRPN